MRSLIEQFANPGSEFRGKPFWAWNGRLEPAELQRQIRLMKRMGLGGFFMHSRVGLDTAYLGKDWFDCVQACVDEARKEGMEAWLYDEDRWPSGAAGGLVTKDPKHRMRSLHMSVIGKASEFKWSADTVAAFTATVDGRKASGVKRIAKGQKPRLSDGESILSFDVQLQKPSDWYNGATYLDTMSHAAVKKYIQVTYDAYKKHNSKDFGSIIPGIFTDEPNYGHGRGRDSVPWTEKLPVFFRKRYGYDILARLPEVLLEVEGAAGRQVRYHYFDCITFLFVDAFSRQAGEWCEKNGIQFTGHVLAEESLSSQTDVVGSAMRFYEYMQAPGMDILTEHNREYDTAKQVASVARQFGRKWRLTETYGCTGWDFPFAGHKAIGDWQLALGINLRCQHLSWYTMEGQAKRDYPAGIFYQSPWWEHYTKVEDHYARVHSIMTRGEEVRDLLVIHPIESRWIEPPREKQQGYPDSVLDTSFRTVRDTLLAANIDFDYGDEEMISRHASVKKAKAGEPTFALAKAAYKAVVVPHQLTMRRTTLALLEKFKAAGGTVVFAGEVAANVDALPSEDVKRFAEGCPHVSIDGEDLPASVECCRRIGVSDERGRQIAQTLYLLREDKDNWYLYLANVGHDFTKTRKGRDDIPVRDRKDEFPSVRVRGFAGAMGDPVELDPDTGEVFAADFRRESGAVEIATSLPKLGSRVFVVPKKAGGEKPAARRKLADVRGEELGGRWSISCSEANALVMDRPRFRIADGAWNDAEEILRVDAKVRDALGIPHRGGQMVQPWARKKPKNPKKVKVELEYAFASEIIPTGDMAIGIERPEAFRISVNGYALDTDVASGWWTDRSLAKVPVDPSLIRPGRNELKLEIDYPEDFPGLEIVYLLGAFGARVEGVDVGMTAQPSELDVGDWAVQGLPFYGGSVSYIRKIAPKLEPGERLFVQVPDYRGVGVRVLVDGQQAGIVGWEPNEVDVTDFVKGGSGMLAIEILGHRRNSHGPHHINDKWPRWTGPGEYVRNSDTWFDGYQLVPCGLMAAPRLVVRK